MGAPTAAIIAEKYIQYMEHTQTKDGLAMGAPTSEIIAETYIQYMGHTQTTRWTSYGSPNISNNSRNMYTVYETYTSKQMD
jgi:hypothetical protein